MTTERAGAETLTLILKHVPKKQSTLAEKFTEKHKRIALNESISMYRAGQNYGCEYAKNRVDSCVSIYSLFYYFPYEQL